MRMAACDRVDYKLWVSTLAFFWVFYSAPLFFYQGGRVDYHGGSPFYWWAFYLFTRAYVSVKVFPVRL
jgi:hypothetical protein